MGTTGYEVTPIDPGAQVTVGYDPKQGVDGEFWYVVVMPEGERVGYDETEPLVSLIDLVSATLEEIEWSREAGVLRKLEEESRDRRSRRVAFVLASALR